MAVPQVDIEELLVDVFREQRSRLYGYLVRGAGDRHVAEDMLQELFLRLWDHRHRIAGEPDRDGMKQYLWRAARNLLIDEIRYRQRSKDDQGDPEKAVATPDHHTDVEHRDCLRIVRETVARLKNRRARDCLQGWLDGKELAQIAGDARLTTGQVRGLLQRARSEVILRAGHRMRRGTS